MSRVYIRKYTCLSCRKVYIRYVCEKLVRRLLPFLQNKVVIDDYYYFNRVRTRISRVRTRRDGFRTFHGYFTGWTRIKCNKLRYAGSVNVK